MSAASGHLARPGIARLIVARYRRPGSRSRGWRIFPTTSRWQAQRRNDWKGNELYDAADADTAAQLAAKLRLR